jgi:hypothetical protein
MTIKQNNENHARQTAKAISEHKPGDTDALESIWHWVNGVADGLGHFLGSQLTGFMKAVEAVIREALNAYATFVKAYQEALVIWVVWGLRLLRDYINKQIKRIDARIARQGRWLEGLIFITTGRVLALALHAVGHERAARMRAVRKAEAGAIARIRAMHGVIEREAASAYSLDSHQRTSMIVKLLDFAVVRDPLLKDVVGKISGMLLDLLAIDDPLARIALGFLIKEVIDRLGVDKAVGSLISDLMEPLIGHPKPRGVHSVVEDLAQRIDALEGQFATFFKDGGSQVEQAGSQWRDITSVASNIAIAAFCTQAVVDPSGWASEINGTVGRAANDVADAAGKLFKGI